MFPVFLLFSSICSLAQAPVESCLLWEVSGNGLSSPSYLYGTIHLIPKKDFKIDALTKEAFGKCKLLALEVDLNMDKETKEKVGMSTLLPNQKSLEDFMSKSDYELLSAYIKDTLNISSLKWMLYKRIRPFYLSSLLVKEISGKTESYEEHFMKMAEKRDMPLTGLESVMYQISISDSVSLDKQIEMLIQGIRSGKDPRKELQELVEVYKSKDLSAMQRLMIEEGSDLPDFEELFLNRRNRNWIPVIEQHIKQQATFVAVGAAHLMGENGIVSLLRRKGYSLSPVQK